MPLDSDRVSTTIFTGFLGSGKTTIIGHLIDQLQASDQQVIYIKNELGDLDIDTQLIQGKHIQTKELLNGCICCTLVGPFMAAANEVIETFHPNRIIIEASGAADPSALALMVSGHPRLSRDGVISIIDVVNFTGYKDLSTTARRQTEFTDIIVFNKVELVDLNRKRAVVGYVRELNDHSPIVEAPNGQLDSELVFGISSSKLNELLTHPASTTTHNHLSQDHLESVSMTLQQPVREDAFVDFLSQLPNQVFRVKGFVQLTNEQMRLVNRVGSRTELEAPPTTLGFRPTTLVFIGFGVIALADTLRTQLTACT